MWQMTGRNSAHNEKFIEQREDYKDRDYSLSRISYFEEQIGME